jgi:hypothetical protein
LPDFEDNIQLASAEAISADHVTTWNKKHFQSAQISILTPEAWLAVGTVAKTEADLQRPQSGGTSAQDDFCASAAGAV